MPPETKRSILIFIALAVLAVLAFAFPGASRQLEQTLDLHELGFPADSENVRSGVFYLDNSRIALFFDQRLPSESPHDRALKLMVFNTEENHPTAQLVLHADPKAMDLTAGPGGMLFGREGKLSFYDSNLQLLKSIPLARGTTGVKFDRYLNQIVIMAVDEKSGQHIAHFKDGNSLQESAALSYPIKSQAIFGNNELVYHVSGNCKGAAHVISTRAEWHGLEELPACDPLAFIGDDSLAYAVDGHLYVVDSKAHQRLSLRIPETPDAFHLPGFIGLSDDHTRLALSALQRQRISSGWPYYEEVFVYDLVSKRMIFEHALKNFSGPVLSPDGHQLAVIEQGVLTLLSVP
jgi:hypothetical protein